MRRILSLILIVFMLLTGCSQKEAPKDRRQQQEVSFFDEATVIRHVDGDTFVVKIKAKEEKVRLIGVNTPETKHPKKGVEFYGKEASEFTKSSLLNKKVFLEKDAGDKDRYGRLLRYVWLEKPSGSDESEMKTKMFNAVLLLNGYAQVMTIQPNVKYQDSFLKFQREAKEKKKGLWGK